jgi:large subunit ribosomal protein L11
MQIKLLTEGGNLAPNPGLSQKLGPLGLNMGEVIKKINEATNDFKGLKVPVELDIDASTKEIKVNVFSPPVSGLLKKELGIEKGSGIQNKAKVANASIEQIILVAKNKMPDMLSKDLKSALKTVVGTCVSLGVLIEGKNPKEIEQEIDEGKYDKEINAEKIETSPEKRKRLDEYFTDIKSEQDKLIKQEQAAKEAEEEKKAEEASASGEEKKEEGAEGAEEKKEEKKA